MIKKYVFLYPLLVAVSPAVFLWSRNFGEVPVREVFSTVLVLGVFGGLVLAFFAFVLRDRDKASLMTAVTLLPALYFNNIYNIFFFNALFQLRWRWAFVIMLLALAIIFYKTFKTDTKVSALNRFLASATALFILLSLIQVGWNSIEHYRNNTLDKITIIPGESSSDLRDMYYIILDGYSRPSIIKEVMGFGEIDEFTDHLEQRGFYIAKQSSSNFPSTAESLPSSLNMRYLDRPDLGKKHFQMSEDHLVKDFFKSQGYKYIHFGAEAFTFFNKYADENVNIGLFSPYQKSILENTIEKPIEKSLAGNRFAWFTEKFGFLDARLIQWERTNYQLDRLAEIASTDHVPTFVFAHFLLPQGPYVFNADGSFVSEEEAAKRTRIENYLNQVSYINKEIAAVVDTILENSEPDPIIILQGDHGFAFGILATKEPELLKELTFKPGQQEELIIPNVNYSFPNLNAYYLPDGGDTLLYDSISPVNTFRLILNYYFGQNFKFLDDISYVINPNDPSQYISIEDLQLDR